MAVGHSIVIIIFYVLQAQKPYEEIGGNYLMNGSTRRLRNVWCNDERNLAMKSHCGLPLTSLERRVGPLFSKEIEREEKVIFTCSGSTKASQVQLAQWLEQRSNAKRRSNNHHRSLWPR